MNSRSMWQMSRAAGFAFVLALLPVATSAQRTGEEFTRALDRFTLFTNCAPVTLSVWLEGDTVPGLTDESVTRAVRSRLRSARIYDEDSEYRAYFHVVGRAFHLSVELLKPLYDYASEERFRATTWRRVVTGTHSQDGNYVLSGLVGPSLPMAIIHGGRK